MLWPGGSPAPLALSTSAHAIWSALEYPATIDDVSATVAAAWAVSPRDVAPDVASFVATLEARGLATTTTGPSSEAALRYRYLGLLKRALANSLYPEHELRIRALLDGRVAGDTRIDRIRWLRDIRTVDPDTFEVFSLYRSLGMLDALRMGFMPTSMVGLSGLDNIEYCAERVIAEGIPGDFLEAGVAAGGSATFLRALQVAYGVPDRRVWAADSFKGLPAAEAEPDVAFNVDLTEPTAPLLASPLDTVRTTFSRYGLLDTNVRFLEGWFADTLPGAPVEQLAILRVDADMYQSTLDVLNPLYDRVSPGGFVIVDDYGMFPPCRKAVDEFRQSRRVDAPIEWVDADRIYWRNGS